MGCSALENNHHYYQRDSILLETAIFSFKWLFLSETSIEGGILYTIINEPNSPADLLALRGSPTSIFFPPAKLIKKRRRGGGRRSVGDAKISNKMKSPSTSSQRKTSES